MAFVEMQPAAEDGDFHPGAARQHQRAGMAWHSRLGEVGHVGEGETVPAQAEARVEADGNAGFPERGEGGLEDVLPD